MLFERSRFKTAGSALRFNALIEEWDEDLYPDRESGLRLDRAAIGARDLRADQLLRDDLVLTCSPDYRAILVFPESYWNDTLRPTLESLPNQDPESRRFQRVLLGHATPVSRDDPLIVPVTQMHFARLTGDNVLIVFDAEYAEIWSDSQLARIASNLDDLLVC